MANSMKNLGDQRSESARATRVVRALLTVVSDQGNEIYC